MREIYWDNVSNLFVIEINGMHIIDWDGIEYQPVNIIGTLICKQLPCNNLKVVTKDMDKLLRILYEV